MWFGDPGPETCLGFDSTEIRLCIHCLLRSKTREVAASQQTFSRSAELGSPVSPHLEDNSRALVLVRVRSPPRSPGVPASPEPVEPRWSGSAAPHPHTPLWVTPSGSAHLPPAGGSWELGAAAGMSASGRRLETAALPQGGSPRRRRAKQGHRGRLASAPGARPRQVTWARASDSPLASRRVSPSARFPQRQSSSASAPTSRLSHSN